MMCEVGSGGLEKEKEFVQKCMQSLSAASDQLDQVLCLFWGLCFSCVVSGENGSFALCLKVNGSACISSRVAPIERYLS